MHKLQRDLKIVGIVLAIFVILGLVQIFKSPAAKLASEAPEIIAARLRSVRLNLQVADTPAERSLGLSNRTTLGEFEGLLFMFEEPGKPAFWMKDMNFSIDILWLDEDLRIVAMDRNISPSTFPETFSSPTPVRFVLELNAGFADTLNLRAGDQLTIEN